MVTVLVVDDNEIIRMTIRDFLELDWPDVTVLEAANGRQGFSLATEAEPDIILLDAEMPEMNGYELAQALKASPHLKHIPLIAISSAGQENEMANALRAMCDDSLIKPFSLDDLTARVRMVWRQTAVSL